MTPPSQLTPEQRSALLGISNDLAASYDCDSAQTAGYVRKALEKLLELCFGPSWEKDVNPWA